MKLMCSEPVHRHHCCRTFSDWFGFVVFEIMIFVDVVSSISTNIEDIVSELDKPSEFEIVIKFDCPPNTVGFAPPLPPVLLPSLFPSVQKEKKNVDV